LAFEVMLRRLAVPPALSPSSTHNRLPFLPAARVPTAKPKGDSRTNTLVSTRAIADIRLAQPGRTAERHQSK
jgi:hypothetical protein